MPRCAHISVALYWFWGRVGWGREGGLQRRAWSLTRSLTPRKGRGVRGVRLRFLTMGLETVVPKWTT